jgi:ATP phosphoribosyltransferase regulatory subunit
MPAGLASMLQALAELCGGREVLELAQACLVEAPDDVHAALDELLSIADALELRYPELPLYFDLGELRGYHYHTGVVFAAFVPGVGQSIAQGGRYDDIGAAFGRARPATGFSTDLKTLVTLGQRLADAPVEGVWAPDVHDLYLWKEIQRLRRDGLRVVQALPGQALADAAVVGCDRQLVLQDGRWQVVPVAS